MFGLYVVFHIAAVPACSMSSNDHFSVLPQSNTTPPPLDMTPHPTVTLKNLRKTRDRTVVVSSHSLSIETGINNKVYNVNRLCQFCKSDVEDKFHFVLKCPVYDYFRKLYIKRYYRTHPSVFKLVLCTENFKDMCNLGIFLMKSFNLRQNIIMSS